MLISADGSGSSCHPTPQCCFWDEMLPLGCLRLVSIIPRKTPWKPRGKPVETPWKPRGIFWSIFASLEPHGTAFFGNPVDFLVTPWISCPCGCAMRCARSSILPGGRSATWSIYSGELRVRRGWAPGLEGFRKPRDCAALCFSCRPDTGRTAYQVSEL